MRFDSFKKKDQKCPICGKLTTKANYYKHYNACSNPNSKLNLKKNKLDDAVHLDHDDLFCKFCGKECKNKNSLIQHEIRCKENPNRKNIDSFSNYIRDYRKGNTKYNDPTVAKQAETMKQKYENGYIHPMKGKHNIHDYIWQEHNDFEIKKWLDYVNLIKNDIVFPEYSINYRNDRYSTVKNLKDWTGVFEHYLLMYYLLNGNWSKENTVHHINEDIHDNSLTNLLAFRSNPEHKRFHNSKFAYLTYNEETHLFECEIKHK